MECNAAGSLDRQVVVFFFAWLMRKPDYIRLRSFGLPSTSLVSTCNVAEAAFFQLYQVSYSASQVRSSRVPSSSRQYYLLLG